MSSVVDQQETTLETRVAEIVTTAERLNEGVAAAAQALSTARVVAEELQTRVGQLQRDEGGASVSLLFIDVRRHAEEVIVENIDGRAYSGVEMKALVEDADELLDLTKLAASRTLRSRGQG